MEVKSTIPRTGKLVHFLVFVLLFLLSAATSVAQPIKNYTVKNGKMLITISKDISEPSLDSFISRYDLSDLALKEFMRKGFTDSLTKLGWTIEMNNRTGFMLSKPIGVYNDVGNRADKIVFAEKFPSFAERFPIVSSKVRYGFNRFRNKFPFAVNENSVTFFLRGNINARRVMLSGSFNDWSISASPMQRVDSGWITSLKLSPGKYWYKFIVDGDWTIDKDNLLIENDGLGNDNSVFYKPNYIFKLNGYKNAKRVYLSGSFNEWRRRELEMTRTESGWQVPVYLADGTHRYRFVVDNDWIADPDNPDRYPNEYGEYNSVVRLGKPYIFKLDGYGDAKTVTLAGSFNAWRRDELFMKKTASGWELPYTLGPGNYEYIFIIDGTKEARPGNVNVQNGNTGNLYFVIEPNYTFRLKGYPNAKTIFVAGDFNNWSERTFAMHRENDEWVFAANLSPGKHLYKFIVDGKWIIDPGNKLWEQNEYGTGNSVIWIGQ